MQAWRQSEEGLAQRLLAQRLLAQRLLAQRLLEQLAALWRMFARDEARRSFSRFVHTLKRAV